MRRTRLVAAAFAGSVCLATLAPAAVASEPVAEVSPHRVRPGGSVTVTVTCSERDKEVDYIVAYSQAFEKGEAKLKLLPRGGYGKATYSGKARIASSHHSSGSWSSDSYGSEESYGSSSDSYGSSSESYLSEESESSSESSYGSDEDYGSGSSYDAEDSYGSEESSGWEESESYGSEDSYGSEESSSPDGDYGWEEPESYTSDDSYGSGASRHGKRYGINGSCPGGRDFTASVIVERKPSGGAHAGQGGSQGAVNTTAVAAGGALVAATVGFGVYALRRRRSEV